MKNNDMKGAYRVAHELLRDRLKDKAPEILQELDEIMESDVIITRGQHDYIEKVMQQAGTPYTLLDPVEIEGANLRPDQIVFVNCPGNFSSKGIRNLVHFVHEGGFLFTTDWALKHVLEPAFPGVVEYNGQATRDEVVRVEVLDKEDPFLASILDSEDDPQWWLEGSSYPIRILDSERVKVLVTSRELGERYGESPVFITFDHGEGTVYHMISHFYLQRVETRTQRHMGSSFGYMAQKGISPQTMNKYSAMGAGEMNVSEVESAYVSRGMMSRVMWEKRKQMKKMASKKRRK